jgi:hypothetical protein
VASVVVGAGASVVGAEVTATVVVVVGTAEGEAGSSGLYDRPRGSKSTWVLGVTADASKRSSRSSMPTAAELRSRLPRKTGTAPATAKRAAATTTLTTNDRFELALARPGAAICPPCMRPVPSLVATIPPSGRR